MQHFKVVPYRPFMAQAPNVPIPNPVPPPEPTFSGLQGTIESLAVLTVLSASAWAGIRVGLGSATMPIKAAGWVGGVGSALLGLLYLGTKVGIVQDLGLPAIRVTPA